MQTRYRVTVHCACRLDHIIPVVIGTDGRIMFGSPQDNPVSLTKPELVDFWEYMADWAKRGGVATKVEITPVK